MENRDSIVRKLAALKAKFEHAATSEAEATSAINKYNELMAKYRLTETDLNIRESSIKIGKFPSKDYGFDDLAPMCWLITPISMVTETKGVCFENTFGLFLGTMADVQHAEFLWDRCEDALTSAWAAYQISPNYKSFLNRGNKPDEIKYYFINGWLQRMTRRLLDMVPENREPTRNALVVLKNALITQAMGGDGQTQATKAVAIHGHSPIHYEGGLEADKVSLRREAEVSKKLTDGRG